MNHIEEMMRIAGVEPVYILKGNRKGIKFKATFTTKEEADIYLSEFGGYLTKDYNFTPEKQLEIIQLIADKNLIYRSYLLWGKYRENGKRLPEILAQLTTELIKANELDKQEVKRILEG